MDIRTLRYFLTIADTKGITPAAKILNMTQPPLSNQLKALEAELGFHLFNRVGKSFFLTAEGRMLYARAKKLVDDFDSTIQLFADMNRGIRGTLKIGTTRVPSLILLPQATSRFMLTCPGVHFRLTEGRSWDIKKALDDGSLDLAFMQILFDKSEYDSIEIESLLCDNGAPSICVVGRKDFFTTESDSIGLKDIIDLPLIVHIYQKDFFLEACHRQNLHPNIICTNTDLFSSLMWSKEGIGVALMLNNTSNLIEHLNLSEYIVSKKIFDLHYPPRTHHLIWRKDTPLSSVAKLFIGEISNMLDNVSKLNINM